MTYDAIIVGAGPAGGYLAYLLAKRGFNIAVIDKESFPRNKVCGGGISNKSLEVLDFDISPIIERNIVGAFLTYQNRHTVIKELEGRRGATVLRSKFDNFILEKAINYGARFINNCSFLKVISNDNRVVQIDTSKGLMKANYLIGADGVYSHLRNSIFGRDLISYAPSMEALVYVDDNILEKFGNRILIDFGGMRRGYGWIFPKKDHLNVGVYSIFGAKNIKNELKAFMDNYKSLQNYRNIKTLSYSIPLTNKYDKYQKNNIILIGDAAGCAESFYGEGIYFAFKSAQIAAKTISNNFGNSNNQLYTKYVKKEILPDMNYSLINARLFFLFQKQGFYRMVRNIHVNYYYAELISGNVNHRECFYKTILTSPYWLFSKKYDYTDIKF